jgi:hypothetical protein
VIAVHWRNYLTEGCGDYVIAECLHIGPMVPDAVNLSLDTEELARALRGAPEGSPFGAGDSTYVVDLIQGYPLLERQT